MFPPHAGLTSIEHVFDHSPVTDDPTAPAALLRAPRPDLLLRYSRLPEAADDAAVWQALLDVLPVSSPRRAAAANQLLRLRRTPRPR
ncbi:hypothetical protein GCM10023162_04710 [Klenkia terrae]